MRARADQRAVARDSRADGQGRRRLSAGPPGVRRAARRNTARRCTSPRATSAACTSAAATRATRTRKPPFAVVDAQKQREALALLEEQVFSDKPFQFPPELYNHLAASRWSHWGIEHAAADRLSGARGDRDVAGADSDAAALAADAGADARLGAEGAGRSGRVHHGRADPPLDGGRSSPRSRRWKAASTPTASRPISSLRRNLQRIYLQRLSQIAMGNSGAPPDVQAVSFAELKSLKEKIDKLLAGNVNFDTYTKAHLQESSNRIAKVLDARLTLSRP